MRWLSHLCEPQIHCEFGVTEAIFGAALADVFAGGLTSLGVGAETAGVLGGVGSGALTGAGIGTIGSAITGGDPLTGALTGALTGGAVGGAGAAGLGTIGQVGAGAAAGALGSEITGGNPLLGAATGAGGGLVSGLTGGSTPSSTTTPSTTIAASSTGGTGGAGGSAAAPGPVSVPSGSAPVDFTAGGGGGLATDALGIGSDPLASSIAGNPNIDATTAAKLYSAGIDPSAIGGGGTGGGAAAGASNTGGISGLASKALGLVEKNPGILLGAGALGLNALLGDKPLPAEKSLNAAAGEAASAGRTLSSYIFSGTLPQGAQTAVDAATNAAKAKVKSTYASMGLAGSTSEAEALGQIDRAASAQVFQMADQLLAQGADYSKLSASLYQTLLQTQAQQEEGFGKALGLFAAGLAGAKLNV